MEGWEEARKFESVFGSLGPFTRCRRQVSVMLRPSPGWSDCKNKLIQSDRSSVERGKGGEVPFVNSTITLTHSTFRDGKKNDLTFPDLLPKAFLLTSGIETPGEV